MGLERETDELLYVGQFYREEVERREAGRCCNSGLVVGTLPGL